VKELKEKKAKWYVHDSYGMMGLRIPLTRLEGPHSLLRDSRDAELAAVPIADADVQIIVR